MSNFGKEVKHDIAVILGISLAPTTSTLAVLQVELDITKKAQAEAEKRLELYKNCHLELNKTPKEAPKLKEGSEQIQAHLPYYKIATHFCSRVRHGSHHSVRHIHHSGAIHNIEGRRPASKEVIRVRNETCHE